MKVNVYKNFGFYLLLVSVIFSGIINADATSSARQRRVMASKKKTKGKTTSQDIIKDGTLGYTPTNTMATLKTRVGFKNYGKASRDLQNKINVLRPNLKTADLVVVSVEGQEGDYVVVQHIIDAVAAKLKEAQIAYGDITVHMPRHGDLKPRYFLSVPDFEKGRLNVRVELPAGL